MSESKVYIGDKQVDGYHSILPFRPVMKKVVVHAVQMEVPFKVETLEGMMLGEAGDYLMKGIEGEYYPCKKEIFERTYDFMPKPILKTKILSRGEVFDTIGDAMREINGDK